MKTYLLPIIICFSAATLVGQQMGFRVGANLFYANQPISETSINLQGGVFYAFKVDDDIDIVPSVVYQKVQQQDFFTLPIHLNFLMLERNDFDLKFIGGPYASYAFRQHNNFNNSNSLFGPPIFPTNGTDFNIIDFDTSLSSFAPVRSRYDYGMNLGLGVTMDRISLNVMYNYGVKDTVDDLGEIGNYNRFMSVYLGYAFGNELQSDAR